MVSPVNLLSSKNIWMGLRHTKRCIIVHKYTLHIKTVRQELVPCQNVLSIKLRLLILFSVTPSLNINGLLMVLFVIPAHIITLPPLSYLFTTGTSELVKIHPLSHLSGPSNYTQDSFMKTTLEKSINFHIFLGPILTL